MNKCRIALFLLLLCLLFCCLNYLHVNRPVSAQTTATGFRLIISEFRLRGPNGPTTSYVEIYNNSDFRTHGQFYSMARLQVMR
jgi:hypothetical protein